MAVMGEVNHLARGSHSGEQPKGFLGAEIIERFHDVVGEERCWGICSSEFVIAGYSQR
jgi:hypothetical protein